MSQSQSQSHSGAFTAVNNSSSDAAAFSHPAATAATSASASASAGMLYPPQAAAAAAAPSAGNAAVTAAVSPEAAAAAAVTPGGNGADTWQLMTRTVAHYERLEQIGEGTYGQVYRAICRDTQQPVALKKMRLLSGRGYWGMPLQLIREIKILKQLHHPNLLQMIEVVTSKGVEHLDPDDPITTGDPKKRNKSDGDGEDQAAVSREKYKGNLFLVLEYVTHDLTGLMDVAYQFTPVQIKCIFQQLLQALEYMHKHRYVHRDIKSSNILLDSHYRLKLADFGLARSLEPPLLDQMEPNSSSSGSMQDLTNKVITLWYRPPEILLGTVHYGCAVDVWSAGCILAELFTGKPLAAGKTELDQLGLLAELTGTPSDEDTWTYLASLKKTRSLHDAIAATAQSWRDNDPLPSKLREKYESGKHNIPEHAITLLEKLLVWDPRKRLTASNALQHKYFWTQPVAPSDPAEMGQIQVAADGHFHEFQTKQKRRQAKQKAEEARERAVLKGMPSEDANDIYDKTYKGIMKQVAEEGLAAATEVVDRSKRPPSSRRREDEPRHRSSSRRRDEKRERSRSPDRPSRRDPSARDRASGKRHRSRDRSPEGELSDPGGSTGGGSRGKKRSRAAEDDDRSAGSRERRHRSKERRRSDEERRREKERRGSRRDIDNDSKDTSRRESPSKRGDDSSVDRGGRGRGGSRERRPSKKSKDKKRNKKHRKGGDKEKGRGFGDRRHGDRGGKIRDRDDRRRDRSLDRGHRGDDVPGHYGLSSIYGPPGERDEPPVRHRDDPYGPPGPRDEVPPRHRDEPPARHHDEALARHGGESPRRDDRAMDGRGDHYGPPRRDIDGPGEHYGPPRRMEGPNDQYGPPPTSRRDMDGPPRDYGPPPDDFYRERPPDFRGPPPRRGDGPPPRDRGPPPQGFRDRDRDRRPGGDHGPGRPRDRDRR